MTAEEIKTHYDAQIEAAETPFEKQMLEAERNHKLKMAEEGIDAEAARKASQFECVGCGS